MTQQLVEHFFSELVDLKPLRSYTEMDINDSYMAFYGYSVVVILSTLSRLTHHVDEKIAQKAKQNLTNILEFLHKLHAMDYSESIYEGGEEAVWAFIETLYYAGEEYDTILSYSPPNLRKRIIRYHEDAEKGHIDKDILKSYKGLIKAIKKMIGSEH